MNEHQNTFGPDDNNETGEDQLDRLLSSARWPRPDEDALRRLTDQWQSLAAEPASLPQPGPQPNPNPRGRFLLTAAACVVLLAGLVAWLVSRDDPEGVLPGPETPGSREVAEQPGPPEPAERVVVEGPPHVESPPKRIRGRRRPTRNQQRAEDLAMLNDVLLCMQETPDEDVVCCRPLMANRARFEFLLWEVIRRSTGDRQLTAILALGVVGSAQSVPGLLEMAGGRATQEAALQALARTGEPRLLATLILRSKPGPTQKDLYAALVTRDSPAAVAAWLELIRNPLTRDGAIAAVSHATPGTIELLFAAFESPVITQRTAAAVALGECTDEKVVTRLITMSRKQPGRWEPIAALLWNQSPQAAQALVRKQRIPAQFPILQTAALRLNELVGMRQLRRRQH